MYEPVSLRQFLINAAHDGPVVGLLADDHLPTPGPRFRTRTIDAAEMTTLSGLFTGFARAWGFPEHFGHNKDAFDDCMRDLDGDESLTSGPSHIAGYLTHITRAHNFLTSDLGQLHWFTEATDFYRAHYRDVSHPSATFAVVLSTSHRRVPTVRSRWHDAGVNLPTID